MGGWSGRPGLTVRGLALGARLRVVLVTGDGPAQEVVRRHNLSGGAVQLASEGLLATALMAAHIKGEERLLIQMQGETPRFSYMGEICANGAIRARLTPAWLPALGPMDGVMLAIKWDGQREVYRGAAEIEHTSLEGALHSYLVRSQQTLGLVRIQVDVQASGAVDAALGLLVERLPTQEMEDQEFEALVQPLRDRPLREIVADLDQGQLLGEPFERLDETLLQHFCGCSVERVESTLRVMGLEELRKLLEEQGRAEVTCNFCGEVYEVPAPRITALIDTLSQAGAPGH